MGQNDDLHDWIALVFVTGVGSRTAAVLLDHFGSPADCFRANSAALELAGIRPGIIEQLNSPEPHRRAERELRELGKIGGHALTLADDRYPAYLRETFDPPIVLFVLGDFLPALQQPAVAIVGSRKCSTYGRNAAEMLARELSARGVTIVSGLARGIDSAAHKGALEGKGLTIAVVATGLDEVYPRENQMLAEKIKMNGALISEFPLATPPLPQHFPFRNRIISGLSLGVLVVEGAERSGSLITARLAMEQNREVFAVPGNITSAKSFGPNYLIKDGAKLVQSWGDVIEEFPREIKAGILTMEPGLEASKQLQFEAVTLSVTEQKLLRALTYDEPMHIDALLRTTALGMGELMMALTNLEMSNHIKQLPGKYFARKL